MAIGSVFSLTNFLQVILIWHVTFSMEKISLQPWKVDNYDSFMLKYTPDFRLAMLISVLFIIIKTCSNLYEFAKIALTKFCLQKTVTKNWEEKFLSMCHCILMYLYEVLVTVAYSQAYFSSTSKSVALLRWYLSMQC